MTNYPVQSLVGKPKDAWMRTSGSGLEEGQNAGANLLGLIEVEGMAGVRDDGGFKLRDQAREAGQHGRRAVGDIVRADEQQGGDTEALQLGIGDHRRQV